MVAHDVRRNLAEPMSDVMAELFVDGLCFGEGPRWRDDRLWLSDMHGAEVLAFDAGGRKQVSIPTPDWPSGLGWLPDGDLLVSAMRSRKVLRYRDGRFVTHADLGALASYHCNDMVVGPQGRAYVGNFGFDTHNRAPYRQAEIVAVEPDGAARVVARDLDFPNGMVITPDGATLIVGETTGGRLAAFDIGEDGSLSGQRVWADFEKKVAPDGICLDDAMGVWAASPLGNECVRAEAGGRITHRVRVRERAFACALGGADGRTLFITSSREHLPEACAAERTSAVEVASAPYPRAGWP